MGYAVTASMTIAAGAQSIHPSLRSARARSVTTLRSRRAGAWTATSLTSRNLPARTRFAEGKREAPPRSYESLGVEGVLQLGLQVAGEAVDLDARRRRDGLGDGQRDVGVRRRLRAHGARVDRLADEVRERVVLLELRVVVDL